MSFQKKEIKEEEVDDYLKKFEAQMDAGDLDIPDKDEGSEDGIGVNEETGEIDYEIDLYGVPQTDSEKPRTMKEDDERSTSHIYNESRTVVDQVIQNVIREFVVKSLEEIATVEPMNSELISHLIDDILITDPIVSSSDVPAKEEYDQKIESELEKSDNKEDETSQTIVKDEKSESDKEIEETEEITNEDLIKSIITDIIKNVSKQDEKVIRKPHGELEIANIISDKEGLLQHHELKDVHPSMLAELLSSSSLETEVDYESPSSSAEIEIQPNVVESDVAEQVIQPTVPIDPDVLEPDNPLMVRFQNALKAHLKKQKLRIESEILDLKGEIKEKSKYEDITSNDIYNLEVKINQQQQHLQKSSDKIEEIISNWENVVNVINSLKVNFNEKSQQLETIVKKDSELQIELDSLSALVKQFSEWEEKQASEITTSRILSERQAAEKKRLFAEKQKLDLLVLSVRKDVLKYTRTFDDMKVHIQSKTNELNVIEQTVADANADIEELLQNNRKIMQLWGKNVITISQRDKVLYQTTVSTEDHKVKYSSLEAEIEGVKNESNQLIKYNEQLIGKIKYIERTQDLFKRRLKEEIEKKRVIEDSLTQVTKMRQSTEGDLRKSVIEAEEIAKKESFLRAEYAKVRIENTKLEETILDKLLEQSVETKTAKRLNTEVSKLRNMIREKEVAIADYENKIAKLMVDTEKEKMLYKCGELELKEVNKEIHEKEISIQNLHTELERTIFRGQQTQSQVDRNLRKLENLKVAKGDSELSPEEIKIRELEKNITDLDEEATELQQFWLRQENHIVAISQQRTDQLQQISVLRKQLIILDKKNMTIEYDIQAQEKERKNYLSTKESLQKKLLKLNEQLYKKKGYKETLDNNNLNIQNQYLNDLKDAEDASIELQNEINNLDAKKMELYKRITEIQKDLLAWEKKLQMAVETRQLIEKLNADGGELANMKNEIHRMEIRHSQLCKAQEKLTTDMELCVTRRDGIVDVALAREKRHTKGGIQYTRQQFLKKIEELKSGIRNSSNDLKNLSKEISLQEELKYKLEEQMQLKNEQLLGLKKATEQMDLQLAEGHLHRQKNLELLVRLQRKCRFYSDIKSSRYKLLFRNESALEVESQKQKKVNSDLTAITESLIHDFPSLQMPFTGILNTLRGSIA